MTERLTFNHGAAVAVWLERPAPPAPPEVRAAPPPPLRDARQNAAYWGAWAFTAFLFFRPQDELPVLEPLHLSEVIAVTSLLALFSWRLSSGLPLVRMTPALAGVIGFAVVMVATVPFSIWPGGAFNAFLDVYAKVALIFYLLTHSVRSIGMLRRLTWLVVVALGYTAIRGVLDYARGVNIHDGRLWGPGEGLMSNPNDFAMNMVTFLPFALVVAFGREPLGRRVIAALITAAMLAVIVFTKSRAGMLGVAAMMVVLIIHAGRVRASLMIAVVLGCLVVIPTAPPNIWARMSSILNEEEDETGSREARMLLMREGWQAFLDHPLTGVGVAQFQNYNPPGRAEKWHETHNVLLQVLAELGILGGVCFLFLMGATVTALVQTRRLLRREERRRRREPTAVRAFSPTETDQLRMHVAAATAAFTGWFTCAQFASIGYYWTYYYLLAVVVVTLAIARERVRNVTRAALPPK